MIRGHTPIDIVRFGITAPFKALIDPRSVFSKIGELSQQYGVYFTALFYAGAWMGASVIAYGFVLMGILLRSIMELDILGAAAAPVTALVYSFVFPLVAAGIDSLLILLVALFSPRTRPLHAVMAVRASSLLPYTLRVVILAFTGSLSFRALLEAGTSVLGVVFLVIGFLLTAYGLRKGLGMPWIASFIAAVLPLTYKIII